jgi:hypothetical protein
MVDIGEWGASHECGVDGETWLTVVADSRDPNSMGVYLTIACYGRRPKVAIELGIAFTESSGRLFTVELAGTQPHVRFTADNRDNVSRVDVKSVADAVALAKALVDSAGDHIVLVVTRADGLRRRVQYSKDGLTRAAAPLRAQCAW